MSSRDAIQFFRIPRALQDRPQWVLWRYEERGGKRTKVPYQPTGEHASTTDPTTWSSLEAVQAARWACIGHWQAVTYAGVGFVFSPDDGLVGIDLDHCRGEQWAANLLARFATYVEITPSWTGYHLIGLGRVPDGKGHRKGAIEVYDRGRYFTVTGWTAAGSALEPQPIQDALDALLATFAKPAAVVAPTWSPPSGDDATILAWAFRERGVEGAFHGTIAINDSEGDWLLLRALARRTRDVGQIDRIIRTSARMRDKWDSPRGAQTYGEWSIAAALAQTVPIDNRQGWRLEGTP